MRTLYPAIQPYVQHTLPVDPPHQLHVEECGTAHGHPVVFLHGGPGSGCQAYHRRFFDPDRWRVVLPDQRGAGRSAPHAEVSGNDTQALIRDLEALREHLGIEQWAVFGGSWGSTLGLAYAQAHPERVTGLILRGIFLGSPEEVAWVCQDGAHRFAPEAWEEFLAPIPEAERDDLLAAYHRRLTGSDEIGRMSAARAWARWEGRLATLAASEEVADHFAEGYTALALALIEAHYFRNHCFLEPGQLLRDVERIRNIPGTIVQGRYDLICPPATAHALAREWPEAELEMVTEAGHAASEPGIVDALVRATDRLADRLDGRPADR